MWPIKAALRFLNKIKQLQKMLLATATDKPFKVVIYTWGHIFNKQ